jgi:4-hydroxy-2-oxoheptanedioate aldolase
VTTAPDIRDALRAGESLVGLWASIPAPLTAEVAAEAGADYVVVDQQHGAVDPSTMLSLLQAIAAGGAAPLVRVARNDPWVIGHALDLGAHGVIVPMVEDEREAAAAVAACRYAPEGVRSFGALRAAAVEAPLCLVMIETRAGLEHVGAVARTPGLDGIYIGPSDLALSLGLQPTLRLEHPPVLEALETIRAACGSAGIACGLHCLAAEDVPVHAARGFSPITAGGDLLYLREALAAARATARRPG